MNTMRPPLTKKQRKVLLSELDWAMKRRELVETKIRVLELDLRLIDVEAAQLRAKQLHDKITQASR